MSSLRDQLLKAGLTTEHKARQVRSEQKKKKKKKKSGAAGSDNQELQQQIAQQRQAEQEKAMQLNQQKQEALKEREQVARVKQILHHHNQDGIQGEVTFNFVYESKVKEIKVSEDTKQKLSKGLLAICQLEGEFYVLPDDPARKIAEVDEKYILLHAQQEQDKPDEDDPYADYQIPDDITW